MQKVVQRSKNRTFRIDIRILQEKYTNYNEKGIAELSNRRFCNPLFLLPCIRQKRPVNVFKLSCVQKKLSAAGSVEVYNTVKMCDNYIVVYCSDMKDISYKGGTTMNCKNKIDKKATGHRLYRLIEESKMTYAEIAEYLGLQSPRIIYEWISGKKLPSTENLYNLADLFQVRMEDILRV